MNKNYQNMPPSEDGTTIRNILDSFCFLLVHFQISTQTFLLTQKAKVKQQLVENNFIV